MIKNWFIALCIIWSSLVLNAQQTGITAEPDTNIILIGQQVKVSVSITAADQDFVSFPILTDSLGSGLEIVKQTEWDTISKNGNYTFNKVVNITSWDSGYYAVPPIPTVINNDTFMSNPFLIGVATVPLDTTNAIADIKGIATDPLTWKDYLDAYGKYLLWVWLVAAILGLTIYLTQRFKKKPAPIVEIKPEIPAHVIAFGRLKQLEDEQLWQNNQIKKYHVGLSEIVREYIENRFNIPALEQTTEEIMHSLRLSELSEEQKRTTRKLLMLTDLVKFAKESPLASENEQVLKDAYNLVESTKIIQVESETKPEQDA